MKLNIIYFWNSIEIKSLLLNDNYCITFFGKSSSTNLEKKITNHIEILLKFESKYKKNQRIFVFKQGDKFGSKLMNILVPAARMSVAAHVENSAPLLCVPGTN